MNNLLLDKTILVAGAGGLLGSEIVKSAIKQGAKVLAVDINLDVVAAKLSPDFIAANKANLELVHLDLTSEKEVTTFFAEVSGLSGAVNASYPRNKTYGAHFFDVSLNSFNENLSLHLGSAFLFTQQCAAYFRRASSTFSLVNVSSVYGVIGPKFDIYENTQMTTPIEYAAIKSAIIHMNSYVINYIKDSRFRVNSISPGGIFDNQPKPFLEAYKSHTNGKGMLDVDDMLGSVMYLLSEQSSFVTGQNIVIDDGFTS